MTMKCFIILAVCALAVFAGDHRRLSPNAAPQQTIGPDPAVQHYGYITVNGTYENGAHLFYWMFEARHNPETAPLVLWLTGGPGCSGMLALLMENGPYNVNNVTNELEMNLYSWTERANVIWIDQPAGSGFSYADHLFDYVVSEKQIAQDVYTFMQEFYQLYPQYQKLPFYITGESYAGHYIPAIANKIVEMTEANDGPAIPLKGIAIGNGWTDPLIQYGQYAHFAYDNGLIGRTTYDALNATYIACIAAIDTHIWPVALDICNGMMEVILAEAHNINVYDIRKKCDYPPLCYNMDPIAKVLTNESIVEILGTKGHPWSSCNMEVHALLMGDWIHNLDKVIPNILAHNIPVLVYSGMDDFVCNYYGGTEWTAKLGWTGHDAFNAQEFKPWTVEGQTAGYYRSAQGLTMLQVLAAGHMVPMDQPVNALDMLTRFLDGKPFGQ